MWWNDRFHGVELLCRIATRVDFSGRQSGVPQPQRHLTDVLCCLQYDHRACVSEYVWRDAFLTEAGMRPSGGRRMLFEQIGEAGVHPAALRFYTVAYCTPCCLRPPASEQDKQCGRSSTVVGVLHAISP